MSGAGGMSHFDVGGNGNRGNESADAEIAALIADVVGTRLPEPHPSQIVLDLLNKDVEANALTLARNEIASIASEIRNKPNDQPNIVHDTERFQASGINPFAPVASVSGPLTWLEDAVLAQETMLAQPKWVTTVDSDHTQHARQAEPEPAPTIAPELPVVEDTDRYAKDYSDDIDQTEWAAPQVAAGGNGSWFGHSPDGLPLWASLGIPVAAVSIFALGFAAFGTIPESEGGLDVAATIDTASEPVKALVSLPVGTDTVVAETTITNVQPKIDTPPETVITPSAVVPAQSIPTLRPVSRTATITGASSVVAPAVKAAELTGKFAPAPSLKPAAPVTARKVARTVALKPKATLVPPLVTPRRTLPVRMFSGRIEPGSAAQLVNAAAEQSGPALSKAEKYWLARDVERALDNEIDGRSVSLKSRQGQRVRLNIKSSSQIQRDFTFSRAHEIGSLPHNMVLEGGWYVARQDVMLHATPALNTGLKHRVLKRHQLIERIATFVDRYGDRWYLMGQRGLAVGFLSAADVALAGAHKGPLGDVYATPPGVRTSELRTVYTTCRNGFIGPEGQLIQRFNVCRNTTGNWVSHSPEKVSTREASLAGPLMPKGGTASAIVLAEATGDPVAFHVFGNRMFRRRMQGDLVYARVGQTTEQVMPDGRLIKLTFGQTYESEGVAPVMRAAAVGAIPERIRVDAGWMKAPIGAKVRATPDLLSQAVMEDIPAGQAVEVLGRVPGLRGDDDWILVGRAGVGFGYVPADQLAEIEGRVSPMAVKNVRTKAVADFVNVVSTCRGVEYETVRGTGTFDACQQADGNWALKAEPKVTRQFAVIETGPKTAP